MIELVLASRSTGCGDCATVCPTHVFDLGAEGIPMIARQEDCQTCFMCELYCQADALFVGPDRQKAVPVDAEQILKSGLLGQYRRDSGWDEWASDPEYHSQFWRMSQIMNGGREISEARKRQRKKSREWEVLRRVPVSNRIEDGRGRTDTTSSGCSPPPALEN